MLMADHLNENMQHANNNYFDSFEANSFNDIMKQANDDEIDKGDCDDNGSVSGTAAGIEWLPEEDDRFLRQIQICGTHNWKVIAEHFPGKTPKQCRQRWHNHLNPEIKRSAWSVQEDQILLHYHKQIGNKWARVCFHRNLFTVYKCFYYNYNYNRLQRF